MSPECRHIHVMGRRCGSPALSGHPYCYFHFRSRTRHNAPVVDRTPAIIHPLGGDSSGKLAPALVAPALTFDFPTIEDRESIQVSASMILTALGRNLLDSRRAASMLYALQVATAVTRVDDDGVNEYLVQIDPIILDDGTDLASEVVEEEAPEETPAPPQPEIQFLQLASDPNLAATEPSCRPPEPLPS